MTRQASVRRHEQRGAALLLVALILIGVVLGGLFSALNSANRSSQPGRNTQAALAQAKDALIGFAATYRDGHANQVFGYLPCPDTNNDGDAEGVCGNQDVSVVGRLPWRTLGLQPPRDDDAECLWYAVSGRAKNNPRTAAFNWDTTGQFVIQDSAGTVLAGATAHERPLAVIIAPGSALGAQARATVGATECGGNNNAADYLEGIGALGTGTTTLTLADAGSIRNGTNNDRGAWITSGEIFNRVKARSDFRSDIDAFVADLANYLNTLAPASLPTASPGNKGIDKVIDGYLDVNPTLLVQKANVLTNWRNNLLYAGGPSGSYTLNGSPTSCRAVLFFGGERTTRTVAPLTAQMRETAAQTGDGANFGDSAMYLEGGNATLFPANGAYSGATQFNAATPAADIIQCINGLGSGSASFGDPVDFPRFVPTNPGVTPDATTNPSDPTVSIAYAAGSSGGCFWFPSAIPLAGKTLRAYYEFQFFYPDTFTSDGKGKDRGNGFTFQMVQGDGDAPSDCGTVTDMGAITSGLSFIIQTDVHEDSSSSGTNDPTGNHTAITKNGYLDHNGTMNNACNGKFSGCEHAPKDYFEESPTPLAHNQRIEIHTGCNSKCSACTPSSHTEKNTYARISVWVDCAECSDVVTLLDRNAQRPTIEYCARLDFAMNKVYFGLTGGFLSGTPAGSAPAQGVKIKKLSLRSD